jgi:hypothetical protein
VPEHLRAELEKPVVEEVYFFAPSSMPVLYFRLKKNPVVEEEEEVHFFHTQHTHTHSLARARAHTHTHTHTHIHTHTFHTMLN